MKVYAPSFFKDFHCTGSACADNCCRMGWDIEIDDDTYNYYKSLDCGLCEHITDDGGEHYIKQKNGQCPFLDENGLCSVVIKYGEEHISEICTEHPRFYQWFGGYKEAGTGLCCEESARLWLANAENISFCEFETDEPDDDLAFDPEALAAVIAARQTLFDILKDPGLSFSQKLRALLIFGLNTQDITEDDTADGFSELSAAFSDIGSVKNLLSQLSQPTPQDKLSACEQVLACFEELDYMRPEFPEALGRIKSDLAKLIDSADAFDKAFPEAKTQLLAVAVYNIYRYVIECAGGAECLPFIVTAVLNVWFVRLWDISLWLDGKFDIKAQISAVKEYSKEIEYSDNTAVLWENSYTDSRLCADSLVTITEV